MIGGQIEDADLERNLEAEHHIGIDREGASTAQGGFFKFEMSEILRNDKIPAFSDTEIIYAKA